MPPFHDLTFQMDVFCADNLRAIGLRPTSSTKPN
jgi:hypothetical protein